MKITHLAYWWLFFWVQVIALSIAGYFGVIETTWYADPSKLSIATVIITALASIWIGFQHLKAGRKEKINLAAGWFLSELTMSIGMLGTVIGFIYMITAAMGSLPQGELTPQHLKTMINSLSLGIGTALWTTLWGLVGSISLKIQMNNLEAAIESAKDQE